MRLVRLSIAEPGWQFLRLRHTTQWRNTLMKHIATLLAAVVMLAPVATVNTSADPDAYPRWLCRWMPMFC